MCVCVRARALFSSFTNHFLGTVKNIIKFGMTPVE